MIHVDAYQRFEHDASQSLVGWEGGKDDQSFEVTGVARSWIVIAKNGRMAGTPGGAQCSPTALFQISEVTFVSRATTRMEEAYGVLPINVTCIVHAVKSMPIPPATAVQGQLFFLDISSRFPYFGPTALKWVLTGLAPGSGLALNPSGVVTGVPNAADCAAAQPLSLRVTAQDGKSNVAHSRLFLTVKCAVNELMYPALSTAVEGVMQPANKALNPWAPSSNTWGVVRITQYG
jgi:hypothetical protein